MRQENIKSSGCLLYLMIYWFFCVTWVCEKTQLGHTTSAAPPWMMVLTATPIPGNPTRPKAPPPHHHHHYVFVIWACENHSLVIPRRQLLLGWWSWRPRLSRETPPSRSPGLCLCSGALWGWSHSGWVLALILWDCPVNRSKEQRRLTKLCYVFLLPRISWK